jgi:uncharacterized protein
MAMTNSGVAKKRMLNGEVATRRLCTLLVTHQCNLNCVYCYESFKSKKSMSFETAKTIIESEFEFVARSDRFDELAIDFLGGEPLLQFDLIHDLAEWIWSAPRPVRYILFSTTNGTLLNDRMKQWFREHKDQYYLCLSLDGTPDMHAANRGHSLAKIDLDFFRETWPEQPVKMTVSCGTIDSLAEGIIYLQEKGFHVGANLGYGMPWNDNSITEFGQQLRQLGTYYLEQDQMPRVSLLDLPIEYAKQSPATRQTKYCGTGTHMVTYDVDGKAYPCHLFTPLVLGTSKSVELQSIKFQEEATITDQRCSDCSLQRICPTCYGFNYKSTGNVALRDQMMCRLFKAQALANCWLQTQLLRRRYRQGPLSLEDVRRAKACITIREQLGA